MSLFEDASLIVTPNGRKSGKIYALKPFNGSGDLTVVRATTATYVGSDGLIKTALANEVRFDYTNGSCPSILVEPQRTNLALNSEDFSNASWDKLLSSITSNTATSPSGIQNADTFTANGLSGFHHLFNVASLTTAATYSISVFAKKGTNNFIQITGGTIPFGVNFYANFDLNNGTLGTVGSAATARIENYGNGWYRCIVTGTAINNSVSDAFGVFGIVQSTTSAIAEVNTLNTSVFLWGAQLEAGSNATSYIPTVASAVTRNADIISNSNLISKGLIVNDYTLVLDITNPVLGSQYILDSIDISFNRTGILRVEGTSASVTDIVGGSSLTITNALTIGKGKMCLKRTGNVLSFFTNGIKSASTTTTTAGTINKLSTGVLNSTTGSYVNSIVLFPLALTDQECINLTTI